MPEYSEHPVDFRLRLAALIILIASVAFIARIIPTPRTIDDAFITFRYSRNIVEGEGFVYIPGSRTLGTTTPLYTLLMAGIGFVTGSDSYPWFALIVNSLADACTAGLLTLIIFQVTRQLGLAALMGGLWSVAPMSVTFAVGGMETSVVILWSVAAAAALLNQRERMVGLFAALGILTRIDAVIWAGLLMAYQVLDHWWTTRATSKGRSSLLRRLPWQSWLVFAAILAPWYLFSLSYFGTLLSRSLSAKTVAYVVPDLHAFVRLLQHLATPFFDHETFGVPGIVIGIVLYPALAIMGLVYTAKRSPRLAAYLIYPWPYVAIFSIMNPVIFRWYLAPILPAYMLAILIGVWGAIDAISRALSRPRISWALLSAFSAIWIVFSLNAWVIHPDHGPDHLAPKMAWHQIELYYRDMAETLRETYGINENTLVAAGDIGAVGYYSRAHILDTVGLITPEMSEYYPLDPSLLIEDSTYAVPPAIIYDYQPDYIVFMEMFVRNGLAREPEFAALYQEVKIIPTDFYGTGMILYQRRDLAVETLEPAK